MADGTRQERDRGLWRFTLRQPFRRMDALHSKEKTREQNVNLPNAVVFKDHL